MSAAWSLPRGGSGFPASLEDLGAECPAAIYGRGSQALVEGLAPDGCVAIVGGRRATPYALDVARTIAAELTDAGMTVISGMAFGVDGSAHRGAIDLRAPTVAVLAGGPERPSPLGQRQIYRAILANEGAVISENAEGTEPFAHLFPARNRIMAALAGMTVVVEAASRSGSLITARQAAALGREVGAVPGQVGVARSAGSNALLADGACVVRDATDVLDAMLGPGVAVRRQAETLEPGTESLIEALEDGIGDLDGLAIATGLEPPALASLLTRMEVTGRVALTPGGCYALCRRG